MPEEPNPPLFTAVQKTARRLGIDIEPEFRAGVSDANLVADEGVPVLDGLGPAGARDHRPDEYLLKDTFFPELSSLPKPSSTAGISSANPYVFQSAILPVCNDPLNAKMRSPVFQGCRYRWRLGYFYYELHSFLCSGALKIVHISGFLPDGPFHPWGRPHTK